jgi:hypothetical protein
MLLFTKLLIGQDKGWAPRMHKGKEQTYSAGFIILHLCETTKNIPCRIFFNNILKKQKE